MDLKVGQYWKRTSGEKKGRVYRIVCIGLVKVISTSDQGWDKWENCITYLHEATGEYFTREVEDFKERFEQIKMDKIKQCNYVYVKIQFKEIPEQTRWTRSAKETTASECVEYGGPSFLRKEYQNGALYLSITNGSGDTEYYRRDHNG